MRIKGNKKGKRSARNASKGVYKRQAARTSRNKHRRAISRAKRLAAVKANPLIGSPSQVRARLIARGIARCCDIMLGRKAA